MSSSAEPVDLRVRRTRKLLWEALLAEMSERAFEEITDTDTCERAMTHHTTCYKHYAKHHEDKFALSEQGTRQMYDALVAEARHDPPSAFTEANPPKPIHLPFSSCSPSTWRSISDFSA
jgi:hypothetical protein